LYCLASRLGCPAAVSETIALEGVCVSSWFARVGSEGVWQRRCSACSIVQHTTFQYALSAYLDGRPVTWLEGGHCDAMGNQVAIGFLARGLFSVSDQPHDWWVFVTVVDGG